ncbi:hypothetical protein [uncultured Idiomarina sp.]|uniref:P-loop ATPase, Sll1717 family n=1 Tax=uncultured Idiomarina sp. TaxID=352961 RepID=UPI0025920D11|nr:hypothetical protein [uncultured Idiomarina sp.]
MTEKIRIRKGLKIGELDAESDTALLESCFFDNGQLNELLDVTNHSSVIVGRTGAGKSAMIYKLSKEVEYSTLLDPNDISIRFLEHSNIIQFFEALNIKIDLFYRALWRHILTIELLQQKFDLKNESQSSNFLTKFLSWVGKNELQKKAVEYFTDWGDKFWLETGEQLKEITKKLDKDVKLSLGTKYSSMTLSAEGVRKLSEEERKEVVSLANQVVSGIQIQKLDQVLDLLEEHAFSDKQKRHYILIDKLDEDWAETDTRCRFIRALIEETRALRRKLPQVKVVSALRRDLIDLVFEKTRDGGFQEEKYEAYLLKLQWSKHDLFNLLSRRVKATYERVYTKQNVDFYDVFPHETAKATEAASDFIINRSLMRPRDVIQFANECFSLAADKNEISWTAIRQAEAAYSTKRLRALRDEWFEFYPALNITIEALRGLQSPLTRSSFSRDTLDQVALELASVTSSDPVAETAQNLLSPECDLKQSDLLTAILMCLYHVGAIGLKISSLDPTSWSFNAQPTVTKGEVKRSNSIEIHTMLHSVLEIRAREIITRKSEKRPEKKRIMKKMLKSTKQ